MAGANIYDRNVVNANPANASPASVGRPDLDRTGDTAAVLPAIDKRIDTKVLHDALKGNDLVQYKLGTSKDLSVAENKDGTYTVSFKEGSLSTISNFSSDGKLNMARSYSMNGELRTGYQGIEASVAELKKVAALQPDIAFKNAF